MITVTNKENCCGCSACANICPKNSIKMLPDKEGFLYPVVDIVTCIKCGLCEKFCPIINKVVEKEIQQDAYLVQIKNETIRKESTAGGAFSAIAQYVLSKKGVVFGVQYNNNLEVVHTYIENEKDLYLYRNSKYVQSKIGNSFKDVKRFLNENRIVCFSGTPCQIEGLKKYLKKDYENLITVDVVCHAVPSPLIWKKYLNIQRENFGDKIKNILFRDKNYYGYKYSQMTIRGDDNRDLNHLGVESDLMLRAFFSDICDRPSCYKCNFKKRYRVSDFTIWDCFNVGDMAKELDDDKGTTRLLIHSEKGKFIFNLIKNNLVYKQVTSDLLTKNVKEMFYSVKINKKRDAFMNDALILSDEDLFNKYFGNTYRVRLERILRVTLCNLGIYTISKNICKKLLEIVRRK